MSDIYEVQGVVVDAETGEIIESDGDPIERIIAAGLEAKAQIKIWESYYGAMRAAAGGMLSEERPRVNTVAGIAKRIAYPKRTARPDKLPGLAAEYELTHEQVTRIYECAKELDLSMLWTLDDIPGAVIDGLTTIRDVSYVQFDPLRKQAPRARPRDVIDQQKPIAAQQEVEVVEA